MIAERAKRKIAEAPSVRRNAKRLDVRSRVERRRMADLCRPGFPAHLTSRAEPPSYPLADRRARTPESVACKGSRGSHRRDRSR
jgi:hypothetical protein